jgi:glutamate dehydrogenase/leucine dehydrogenase
LGDVDAAYELLSSPGGLLEVAIPVRMDDEHKGVPGLALPPLDALGPAKGGIRFHTQTDADEV